MAFMAHITGFAAGALGIFVFTTTGQSGSVVYMVAHGLSTAALFLTVGSVLFVIGWLVGVVLAWSSRRWTLGEKLVATLVFPGGPFAVLFLAGTITGTTMCSPRPIPQIGRASCRERVSSPV